MADIERIVAGIVHAAGGSLVGRVRLQKAAYFLQQRGLKSNFEFEYHHYGPYSRELDNALADAKALRLVDERIEHRQTDGAGYSVFKEGPKSDTSDELFAGLGRDRARSLMQKFSGTNVTVLELAATMHFLRVSEKRPDWREETKRRKGQKASEERLQRAEALLDELGLSA